MKGFFQKYGKAIMSSVFAGLIVLYQLLGDDRLTATEWISIAIAITNAVSVYVIPLTAEYRWTKTAVSVLLAVLQVLAMVILGGLSNDELLLLILTAGQAIGVATAPAVSDNGVYSKQ